MIITESKLLHKFSWLSVWVKAAVRCWEKSFLFYRKKGGWDRKLYQWYISLHCCFNYKVQPLRVCHEAPKTLTQDLWCKKRTALKSKVWNITVPRSKTRPLHSFTGKTWYSCPMSSMQTHTSRHTKMTKVNWPMQWRDQELSCEGILLARFGCTSPTNQYKDVMRAPRRMFWKSGVFNPFSGALQTGLAHTGPALP